MRLGKYQLLERLAVGGMAEIFLARADGIEGFEKLVVCKCILPQRAADADFVRMFVDEARLAATLHHPNVAQALDIGCQDDLHYFTMEYVQGADVRELLQAAQPRGGVPLEQGVTIALGVAAGLHHAHEKTNRAGTPLGIVHRDVSPSNVLVSFDGGVKVVDFGIAKAAAHGPRTRTGTTKGKVSCMSPEQCRGEAIDRRSDLFALGVLLYELTTGVRPFQGDSEYAIIRKIVDEDAAPPSRHRADYPPRLEAIVLRALRRDPDQRYATAQELQVDLETFAQEQSWSVSSVELARFMGDLFGGHRPRRVDDVAESFLHQGLGEGGEGAVTTATATMTAAALATAAGPISLPPPTPLSAGPSLASTRPRAMLWAVVILFLSALSGSAYWLGGRHRAPVHGTAPAAMVATPQRVIATPPAGGERRPAPVLTRSPVEAPPAAPTRRHGRVTRKVDLDAPFPR